jgi:hypothetical protein
MGALALTYKEQYKTPFAPVMPGAVLAEYNNLDSAAKVCCVFCVFVCVWGGGAVLLAGVVCGWCACAEQTRQTRRLLPCMHHPSARAGHDPHTRHTHETHARDTRHTRHVRAANRPSRRARRAPCLWSPCRARAAARRRSPTSWPACGRCVTTPARCSCTTRCSAAWGAQVRGGRWVSGWLCVCVCCAAGGGRGRVHSTTTTPRPLALAAVWGRALAPPPPTLPVPARAARQAVGPPALWRGARPHEPGQAAGWRAACGRRAAQAKGGRRHEARCVLVAAAVGSVTGRV